MAATPLTIELGRFHSAPLPPVVMWTQALHVLGPCLESLQRSLEPVLLPQEKLSATRVWANNSGNAECGLMLDRGGSEGVAVLLLWRDLSPHQCQLRVAPSSRLHRMLVWTTFGASLVAGVVLAKLFLPESWDARARLLGGLASGLGLALAGLFAVVRLKLGVGESSVRRAAEIRTCVEKWWATSHGTSP